MTAAATTTVFEIDDIAAGLTDEKLQNISSKAVIVIAPAKTRQLIHRSKRWNNIHER
jgi:hypothetical protein